MFFSGLVSDEFGNFNNFVERKYVLSDVAFTRKGKLSLESTIKYPLCNNRKTTSIDINRFLRNELNDRGVRITKQAVSEKRQFIDSQVYVDMNDSLISKIYDHEDEMTSFKEFFVFAIDGSIVEIPNNPLTREEFNIPEKTELRKDTSSARISCMADTNWDFIISSNLTNKYVDEIEHALMHLDDAKNKIDMTKTITTYDRWYNSVELMLKTIQMDSYFIIRGKISTFKKQQKQMKNDEKTDETFEINLKKSQINNFFTDSVKKIRKKNTRTKSQNSIRKTKNWRNRNTIYQFTKRNSNTRRIKTIIWNKMDNRKRLR